MGLAEKTCVPCRGGVPPLTAEQISPLAAEVTNWHVVNNHHIEREFKYAQPSVNRLLSFTDTSRPMNSFSYEPWSPGSRLVSADNSSMASMVPSGNFPVLVNSRYASGVM